MNKELKSIGKMESKNRKLNQAIRDIDILTTIDLQFNNIGDHSAENLAAALEQNQTLTTIDLSSNEIGADGARALALALGENQTLTTIGLGSSRIRADAPLPEKANRHRIKY
jgi:Ran GTPase-activating protein (RanGAP) involved in mRNA processing and transport